MFIFQRECKWLEWNQVVLHMFLLKVKEPHPWFSKSFLKASFFYAWVLDEGDDERSQGFSDVLISQSWKKIFQEILDSFSNNHLGKL